MTVRKYTRWTTGLLMEAASIYKNPGEFWAENPAAYMAAKRRNIFKMVTKHMVAAHPPWTLSRLKREARKYPNRTEFYTGSPGAYAFARRQGLLPQICGHMTFYGVKREHKKEEANLAL